MYLSKDDYLEILRYYNIDVDQKSRITSLKKMVEEIIAQKLCSCIKKVDNSKHEKDEARPIAICTDSVVTKKNLKINSFKCKKKMTLTGDKKNKLTKLSNAKIQLKKRKVTLKRKP